MIPAAFDLAVTLTYVYGTAIVSFCPWLIAAVRHDEAQARRRHPSNGGQG